MHYDNAQCTIKTIKTFVGATFGRPDNDPKE
jgi:hypothetical protein